MKRIKTTPQEAAKSVIRILLIFAAAAVGTIGLMVAPFDNATWWFEKLILSKVIAAAGWYAAWRLYKCWRKTDKWMAAYYKSCNEAMETPNPLYIGEEDEQK